jgi:hypothetical protein
MQRFWTKIIADLLVIFGRHGGLYGLNAVWQGGSPPASWVL